MSYSIRVWSPLGDNSDGHEPHPGWSLSAEVYSFYFWVEVCSWEPVTLGLSHTVFNELYFTTLF